MSGRRPHDARHRMGFRRCGGAWGGGENQTQHGRLKQVPGPSSVVTASQRKRGLSVPHGRQEVEVTVTGALALRSWLCPIPKPDRPWSGTVRLAQWPPAVDLSLVPQAFLRWLCLGLCSLLEAFTLSAYFCNRYYRGATSRLVQR